MNKVALIGRLTNDPDVRYSNDLCIARYSLAVNRRGDGTDFINCVAFGKSGEFAEKYLKKSVKIAVTGRIQTGSYTNKDGNKVYTFDVVVEDHEFCEKRADSPAEAREQTQATNNSPQQNNGFMPVQNGFDGLPFN